MNKCSTYKVAYNRGRLGFGVTTFGWKYKVNLT